MPPLRLNSIKELKLMANTLRCDVIRMLAAAGSGHTAGPLGLADIFSVLYFHEMHYDPSNPSDPMRDRLVLSNGHCAPILYAAMARAGFFRVEETLSLRKLGSPFQGHPSRHWLPVETSSGPLGEGLAIACGIALAGRLDSAGFRVYCITSDGEHQEGATWEAVMFAAKYGLDNLVAICDRNYIQIDGNTEQVMPLGDLAEKYRAFGWNAISINGHDYQQIISALAKAKQTKGKPTMIVAYTTPGKGVSFAQNKHEWHGKAPKAEEARQALEELAAERKIIEAEL
ncbi:MAG: transketolase [Candidatus Micrarchaeota archaeon]|nr:transketolase [Candidatus Micrarchaeota archaeon]